MSRKNDSSKKARREHERIERKQRKQLTKRLKQIGLGLLGSALVLGAGYFGVD